MGLTSYTWKKRVEVSIGGEKQNKARLNHTSSSELPGAGKGLPGRGVGPPHGQSLRAQEGDMGEYTRKQACRARAGKLLKGLEKSQPTIQDTNPWQLHAPHHCCPQGTGGTNTTRPRQTKSSWFVGLTLSRPCQWLPKPHFSCQCPIQPTQLFFFFFLASVSLLLPMLEWLVMLLRLEMLSEEFCRLMRSSGVRQRRRRDWERRDQPPATPPVPEHPMGPLSLHPIPPPTQHLLSSWNHPVTMTWGSDTTWALPERCPGHISPCCCPRPSP